MKIVKIKESFPGLAIKDLLGNCEYRAKIGMFKITIAFVNCKFVIPKKFLKHFEVSNG